ncbi:hypothetical protein ABZ858_29700 [Streptomyces sp. NPDC047017]|uniref:hypothetical protein n=1 Tax=Streptomyces sp. NPDC047017 TaxID=3155024 RepID=UPI0033F733F8
MRTTRAVRVTPVAPGVVRDETVHEVGRLIDDGLIDLAPPRHFHLPRIDKRGIH